MDDDPSPAERARTIHALHVQVTSVTLVEPEGTRVVDVEDLLAAEPDPLVERVSGHARGTGVGSLLRATAAADRLCSPRHDDPTT